MPDSSIDPAAGELLLNIVETADAVVSGGVLAEYFSSAGAQLRDNGLLLPHGQETATVSLTDHADESVSVIWSADHNGYGYFSPTAGWVAVTDEQIRRFRVNFSVVIARLMLRADWNSRHGAVALIPDLLWEIGDVRIGRRAQRVPIWFGRRLHDPSVWRQVGDVAKTRPTPHLRILLTSTPDHRRPESSLPGHVVVGVRDVIDFNAGLVINPDILAALLDGAPPEDVHERVHLSRSGQTLVINGNVTINFKSDIHVAAVQKLVQGFRDGKRYSAREILDHARSSATTLRQAFGAERWAQLEPYLKSENGLWGFRP